MIPGKEKEFGCFRLNKTWTDRRDKNSFHYTKECVNYICECAWQESLEQQSIHLMKDNMRSSEKYSETMTRLLFIFIKYSFNKRSLTSYY